MKIVNLSAHDSVRLISNAPWIEGENPKTGRTIKVADLSDFDSVEAYLEHYTVEVLPKNSGEYANPMVKQTEASTYEEEDSILITHEVGGTKVVEGLPEPQEDVLFLTSFVTAQAAARPDVVCPITIAHPETGFAIGAIGYTAFG